MLLVYRLLNPFSYPPRGFPFVFVVYLLYFLNKHPCYHNNTSWSISPHFLYSFCMMLVNSAFKWNVIRVDSARTYSAEHTCIVSTHLNAAHDAVHERSRCHNRKFLNACLSVKSIVAAVIVVVFLPGTAVSAKALSRCNLSVLRCGSRSLIVSKHTHVI